MKKDKEGNIEIHGGFLFALAMIVVLVIGVFVRTEGRDKKSSARTTVSSETNSMAGATNESMKAQDVPEKSVEEEKTVTGVIVKTEDDQKSDTERALNKMGLSLKNSVPVAVIKSVK